MKQTLEEAAYDYATNKTKFRKEVLKEVDPDNYVSRKSDCMEDFQCGAEWQAKQSPWISVEDKLPSLNQKVIVYNGKQVYISHRTEKDYAKDANSFLYGLQTYNVVAWMPIPSFNEILEVNKFERQDKQDVHFEKVED
jgi:hypothetical protein